MFGRNGGSIQTPVIPTGIPASVLLLDNVKRRGPRQGGAVDDASLLHGRELSLGDGEFIRVQGANFGKDRGARMSEEMVVDQVVAAENL